MGIMRRILDEMRFNEPAKNKIDRLYNRFYDICPGGLEVPRIDDNSFNAALIRAFYMGEISKDVFVLILGKFQSENEFFLFSIREQDWTTRQKMQAMGFQYRLLLSVKVGPLNEIPETKLPPFIAIKAKENE